MGTLTEWALNSLVRILLALSLVFALGCEEDTVDEGDTQIGVIPTDPDDPFFPGAFVCDAFNGADDITDVNQGIVGSLFYLEDGVTPFNTAAEYISEGTPVNQVSLYFNTINIPTRPWDRGFVTRDGDVIQTDNGDTLYEWFAIDAHTDIVLNSENPEGDYQFAVLSDDGATLSLDGELIVDNDGDHPTRFGCATEPVSMDYATKLKAHLQYYQGPRFHIAMIIMFRPWPENIADVDDPECGKQGNSRFFDSTQDPPTPQNAYNNLLSRGWMPLAPSNYQVPEDIINMCNFPAPQINNIAIEDLMSTSISLTFTTHVPAKFYIELTETIPGTVTNTPVSEFFVKNQSAMVSDLKPFTLYSAVIVAQSVSGRETRSNPINFRTRP